NSEVKRRSADGSVGSPHVRVGNCQASNKAEISVERLGFFAFLSSGEGVDMLPPVALRLPGLRILGHLLAEGTSMPQSYRRQS
uniref:hypothetical protein n=1 Tax=Klebsiella quasipneumoniae TaxID=1463165 RepID=UPI001CF97D9B